MLISLISVGRPAIKGTQGPQGAGGGYGIFSHHLTLHAFLDQFPDRRTRARKAAFDGVGGIILSSLYCQLIDILFTYITKLP